MQSYDQLKLLIFKQINRDNKQNSLSYTRRIIQEKSVILLSLHFAVEHLHMKLKERLVQDTT